MAVIQAATVSVRPSKDGRVGRCMVLVPKIAVVFLVSLAAVGLAQSAFADGLSPGNGGTVVLPSVLPSSVRETLSASVASSFDSLGQKFGVQNGRLDFFSVRPNDGGFKPLLRGGVGDGGLQLQLKW